MNMSLVNGELLYGFASSGKVKVWKASTDFKLNDDGHIVITVEWGYETGKKQTKIRLVKSGKNKGKANETTVEQQAQLELEYLYQAQIDSNYVYKDKLEELRANPPKNAMLAHKYKDKVHTLPLDAEGNFTEDVYAQPKLNGIRCESRKVDEDEIKYISRTNKPFTNFPHLNKGCLDALEVKESLDSELFNPALLFEHIASMVNADTDRNIYEEDGTTVKHTVEDVHLYTYDLMGHDDLTFKERYEILEEKAKNFPPEIVLVETVKVRSLDHVKELFTKWRSEGYEGLMLRVGEGKYEYSKRSTNLLKYKEMEQDEFRIVNIFPADNDPDKVMFTLWSEAGQAEFQCALKGDKQENLKYLKNKPEYLDQYLTVDYQALSKYNMPLFPVGIAVRKGKVVDGKFIPDV